MSDFSAAETVCVYLEQLCLTISKHSQQHRLFFALTVKWQSTWPKTGLSLQCPVLWPPVIKHDDSTQTENSLREVIYNMSAHPYSSWTKGHRHRRMWVNRSRREDGGCSPIKTKKNPKQKDACGYMHRKQTCKQDPSARENKVNKRHKRRAKQM